MGTPRAWGTVSGISKREELWPREPELIEEELTEAKENHRKQLTWWAIGVTPASVLPIMAATWYDNLQLAGIFVVVALILQTVRWRRSAREVERLEDELTEAIEAADDLSELDEGTSTPPDSGRGPDSR